jgi:putative tricarboxylic transport membrane protein
VLGPKLEVAFRQSLMISHGDFAIFFTRPVSAALLAVTAAFLVWPLAKLAWRAAHRKPATPAAQGERQ